MKRLAAGALDGTLISRIARRADAPPAPTAPDAGVWIRRSFGPVHPGSRVVSLASAAVGPWKSSFELLVPHRSLTQLADAARRNGGRRTKVGLIVRVRDDRLRARYNELSRTSTAPLLKGRLVPETEGTRVIGNIQWTTVMAAPFATLGVGLALLGGGGMTFMSGQTLFAFLFILGFLGFMCATVLQFRGEGASRQFEEDRLRKELLAVFGGRGHH